MARLQSGALLRLVQLYVISLFLQDVLFVVLLFVLQVHLVQLVRVDVGVEVSHDGEDEEDAQQQAGEQQELFPLGRQTYWLVYELCRVEKDSVHC